MPRVRLGCRCFGQPYWARPSDAQGISSGCAADWGKLAVQCTDWGAEGRERGRGKGSRFMSDELGINDRWMVFVQCNRDDHEQNDDLHAFFLIQCFAVIVSSLSNLCTLNTSLSMRPCFCLPKSPFLPSLFSLSLISIGATSPLLLHALFLPLFRPLLTSLLLAQQQHSPIITSHPTTAQALAIHMNTNISTPIVGTMLTFASAPLITFLKIRNMAVAMMEAAVVNKADRKVRMAIGTVIQRLKTERGVRKMERKFRQAPMRKRPNIQWEARRTR